MADYPKIRHEIFQALFPEAPAYRWRQAEEALFRPGATGWSDATSLPREMQTTLAEKMPWISVAPDKILSNANGDTHKAALRLADGAIIETVLMRNRRGQWTICTSNQVGCAMRCAFCATGRLGFTRNLTADEIVDQYRFWNTWLSASSFSPERTLSERSESKGESRGSRDTKNEDDVSASTRISNLVLMGMGEPLANYDNVKAALKTLLKQTDLGATRVTVSTVGLLPGLEKLLDDPDWPPVRLAISLHSADQAVREGIMPTTIPDYLPKLGDWVRRYLKKHGNRRHHLTFEYVMLANVNDEPRHAAQLAGFANAAGHVKINLIPYNYTDSQFSGSADEVIADFQNFLEQKGVTVTVRRSMGQDIAAACGQLANKLLK
ncbi:MAG: 23S rRNA (adenine(2503)-C(2))-methyltransferase RlmN [Patescibacteria group bacterium]|nr:23S rRNA (adenine(2503)-C(2))-methyltransferase RlmN [Patescibacteria group bacterium]